MARVAGLRIFDVIQSPYFIDVKLRLDKLGRYVAC